MTSVILPRTSLRAVRRSGRRSRRHAITLRSGCAKRGSSPSGRNSNSSPAAGRKAGGCEFHRADRGPLEGKAGKFIVITAHYDHVGIQNGQIYNGADDNASGTAALFAIASYFKKNRPEHSLIFVALDAEEMGLQGARHFVANLPVAKDAILLNVNMDMLSRSEKGELYAAGTYHYPQFKPAEAVQKRHGQAPARARPPEAAATMDLSIRPRSLHREKIPFIYFGVEDHPDYHRPTDDFEKIDQAFYIKAVETVVESLRALDKS